MFRAVTGTTATTSSARLAASANPRLAIGSSSLVRATGDGGTSTSVRPRAFDPTYEARPAPVSGGGHERCVPAEFDAGLCRACKVSQAGRRGARKGAAARIVGGRPESRHQTVPDGPAEGASTLARPSIGNEADRPPRPIDEDTRSPGRGFGRDAPADRAEDDVPDVDEPENEPPIERSDGQVYGG